MVPRFRVITANAYHLRHPTRDDRAHTEQTSKITDSICWKHEMESGAYKSSFTQIAGSSIHP